MNGLVRAALDLVRADAEASGVPGPPYIDGDWEFYDELTEAGRELVVEVADQVQGRHHRGSVARPLHELATVSGPPSKPSHEASSG